MPQRSTEAGNDPTKKKWTFVIREWLLEFCRHFLLRVRNNRSASSYLVSMWFTPCEGNDIMTHPYCATLYAAPAQAGAFGQSGAAAQTTPGRS